MKLVGGPRNGEPISINDPDGKSQPLPPGFRLQYRYGPPQNGKQQVQVVLGPPTNVPLSVPGLVETYELRDDGDFHLI